MFLRKIDSFRILHYLFLPVLLILSIYYYLSMPLVPFHPDEATSIYMSSDFVETFSNPLELRFNPASTDNLRQHYRLIDPPMTRYLIGAGLLISGKDSLQTDWDWAAGWDRNVSNGALPSRSILLISRVSVAWVYLFSLYAIYKSGKQLQGSLTGLIAMLLLGTSALVLLHTRRAMEESVLLLGICLSLWSFPSINKRPWLSALAVLLAINTKWTAAVLIPLGILSIFIKDCPSKSLRWRNLVFFLLILVAGSYILNPISWSDPLLVLKVAFQERTALVDAQLNSLAQVASTHVLFTPTARLSALITNTFFNSPAFLDVGNYLTELNQDIQTYLVFPGSNWFRGWIGGIVGMFLTLFGFFLMVSTMIFHRKPTNTNTLLILIGFLITAGSLIATLTLPFQRYVIVLLPFLYLVIAFGISSLVFSITKKAPD